MQHILDIDIAMSTAKQDAAMHNATVEVWYDFDQECYVVIKEDAYDKRKGSALWSLICDVDANGTFRYQ